MTTLHDWFIAHKLEISVCIALFNVAVCVFTIYVLLKVIKKQRCER